MLGHYSPVNEVISLQIHCFSGCSNEKQVLHENQRGTENEVGHVQFDSKVYTAQLIVP